MFRISLLIEWRSKKKIDRFVSTAFYCKVGGKYIGSYGSMEKLRQICWITVFNVYTKFLRLYFEPFGSTPTMLSQAERGTSHIT